MSKESTIWEILEELDPKKAKTFFRKKTENDIRNELFGLKETENGNIFEFFFFNLKIFYLSDTSSMQKCNCQVQSN